VERGAVVVALEPVAGERELREGVGAVHQHLDASGRAKATISRTGKIWPDKLVMWVSSMTFVRAVTAARN